jgi:uncharacterized protein
VGSVIRPVIDRENAWFWEGVERHELLLQRCSSCGALRQPSPGCLACGSLDWDTVPASGRGTIHTWLLSKHPTRDDVAPRIVALVELEEGVRHVSNVVDAAADEVAIGLPVELTFRTYDNGEVTLPQFTLVRS